MAATSCAAAIVVAGCAAATSTRELQLVVGLPTPTVKQIVLLHSNDNWGEVEPCG